MLPNATEGQTNITNDIPTPISNRCNWKTIMLVTLAVAAFFTAAAAAAAVGCYFAGLNTFITLPIAAAGGVVCLAAGIGTFVVRSQGKVITATPVQEKGADVAATSVDQSSTPPITAPSSTPPPQNPLR